MDMVIHQAIRPDLEAMFFRISSQQFQVSLAIFVIEKDCSAIITALGEDKRGHTSTWDRH
jgi:hypothetical protein